MRKLQGMGDKMDAAKDVAGATVSAVGGVAGAVGDAVHAGMQGVMNIHEAKVGALLSSAWCCSALLCSALLRVALL